MNTIEKLNGFREMVDEWTEAEKIEGSDVGEVVETGTLLTAMSVVLSKALDNVKSNLRERAKKELNGQPGTHTFLGTSEGKASITVWEDKLELGKDAAPEALEKILGDRFDLYFSKETKYTVRSTARSLIANVADEEEKQLLLSSVDDKPVTPRVSFAKI